METVLTPPGPFYFESTGLNVSSGCLRETWQKWKGGFQIYFDACELSKKSEEIQKNILLHVIGEQCRDVLDQKPKCATLKDILKELDCYFNGKRNITVERHKFFTRSQKEGESIEQYVLELKKIAITCEFGSLCDDLIKDRLVCGVASTAIRERLLREESLNLKKAMDICVAAIASKMYSDNLYRDSEGQMVCELQQNGMQENGNQCGNNVYEINNRGVPDRSRMRGGSSRWHGAPSGRGGVASLQPVRGRGRPQRGRGMRGYDTAESRGKTDQQMISMRSCSRCGTSHRRFECPAYGKTCLKCSRMNHYARMCVFAIAEDEYEQQVNKQFGSDKNDWMLSLKVNDCDITFKLDTGSDVNILPSKYLHVLGIPTDNLLKSVIKLSAYSGNNLNVMGKVFLRLCYKDKTVMAEFQIVNINAVPILGYKICVEMEMVKRVLSVQSDSKPKFVSEYEDIFQGLGCLPGKYEIKLKNNAVPVIHAPRKLPFAIKDRVKNKLNEMEQQGIIAKVEGPTDWVSSMVIAKKADGDLRVCLDPKELNEYIKREHFRLPTLDEIVSNISGSKYFSTLDASSGFWQVALCDTDLCTFNTPFGRYKFLRMPYGICSASEVFHRKIYQNFDDLDGVCMYIDDLLIYGKSEEEHDNRLRAVLERCRKINLKLNIKKCKFRLNEIKYLGHIISKDGLSPDDSYLKAIRNMPMPTNVKDVERFLGVITYVGQFIPNLSDKTFLLRELLKKDIEWHWNEQHTKSFEELKNCLSTRPVLQFYNMKKPIVLSVDASKCGLGACLLQDGLPVAYGSKALTPTEQGYGQIEKELYAVLFACDRFYAYIYGRDDITIETDHKPLITIIKKPIADAPPRLQRMLLRLQRFTFKLVYKPGKKLFIADTLSRAYITESTESDKSYCEEVCEITRSVVENASKNITDLQFIAIQKSTEIDEELKTLQNYILNGWPNFKENLEDNIKPYWTFKEELYVACGIVWKGEKIVIPRNMRKEMLKKVHIGHLGLEKCKLRAREIMFWPNLNLELKNLVSECQICLANRKQNRKEEMISHEIPSRPWTKVAMDLFHLHGKNYLLIVDYYSKFVEVIELFSTTSDYVINCIKNTFVRHGIPETVVSDCGPQFNSGIFSNFSKSWGFEHVKSSPHYPQSNGQVERMVQTVKGIMKKSIESRDDYRLGILEYINTPLDSSLPSPAELLYSRKLRSIVPTSPNLLIPKVQGNISKNLKQKQAVQKYYYDRGSINMCSLQVGQKVKILDLIKKRWVSETVSKMLKNRSYEIKLINGQLLIRNRKHILIDSINRQDSQPDYNFTYDDINTNNDTQRNICHPHHNNVMPNDNYITRSGRIVRPPERFGFATTSSGYS